MSFSFLAVGFSVQTTVVDVERPSRIHARYPSRRRRFFTIVGQARPETRHPHHKHSVLLVFPGHLLQCQLHDVHRNEVHRCHVLQWHHAGRRRCV